MSATPRRQKWKMCALTCEEGERGRSQAEKRVHTATEMNVLHCQGGPFLCCRKQFWRSTSDWLIRAGPTANQRAGPSGLLAGHARRYRIAEGENRVVGGEYHTKAPIGWDFTDVTPERKKEMSMWANKMLEMGSPILFFGLREKEKKAFASQVQLS